MEFKEIFREKYRVALHAVRANNQEATIAGLTDLYKLFAEQYQKNNADSIVIKAKLSYWQDVFGTYIQIVRQYGLADKRVRKFFGLVEDDAVPSFGNILSGKKDISKDLPALEDTDVQPIGGIDIAGIVPLPGEEKPPVAGKSAEPELPATPIETPNESEPPILENDDAEVGKEVLTYNPDTLEEFIGQQHIVKVLLKEIAIAKAEGRQHLDNILLFGNPGLGKSTLMRLIAKALGVRFEWMDCSQYRNSQQSLKALQNFLMRVARENEPVVIAFDEVHRLTDELQSSLLTLLESRVYVSPPDVNGNVKRIPIDEFTFIAATTDDDKVLSTIKDRCLRLKFQMVDYTPEELKLIYKNKVAAKGLTITEEAIDTCIPRSRGSIRYVNSFVEGLDRALYDDLGVRKSTDIDLDTALAFFEERGIDPIGLEKKDLEILEVMSEDTSMAIGADTLAARVGLDPKKYLSEYESYLIRIGFINITGKGRLLTEKAINYLKRGQTLLERFERYERTPQMTSVNHLFGEPSDPITDKFFEYEEQFRNRNLFRDYLVELIDARNYRKNSDVYKASGISKSTYSKIMNYKVNHKPSKETVAALAIGLKLDMKEAQKLYHSAGYHLGTIEFVDRVIRFFISESRYDIDEVNYCLELYDYTPLGECSRDDRVKVKVK